MGIGDRTAQQSGLTEARIREVDQTVVSPGERANLIWKHIRSTFPELTDWDLVCFSAELLGMMHPIHPWLEEPARRVLGLVYTAHYINAEQIDRESSIRRTPSKIEDSTEGAGQINSGETNGVGDSK